MGESFRGFPGSLFATACRFACLPGGSDRALPQPTETFTPELSTGRSPFPLSGIPTVVTEQAPPAGLAPPCPCSRRAPLSIPFLRILGLLASALCRGPFPPPPSSAQLL